MQSLRWRLVLTFACVTGVVVVAGAWGMTVLVERASWAAFDATLAEEAETLGTILDTESVDDLRNTVRHVAAERDLGPGKFLRVTGADGTVLAEAGGGPPALAAAPRVGSFSGTFVSEDHGWRIVRHAADGGVVTVGAPAAPQHRALAIHRSWIWGSAVVATAILILLGVVITTRATNEILAIADALETIEAGSLDRRLAPRTTSELDHLATVLNRLLARLEKAVAHLTRFTAEAAHELRTPIASLRAHLEVALAAPQRPDSYREDLLDALAQTERLAGLTETLLTLSSVEVGATDLSVAGEPVRLDALVDEVAQSVDLVAQEQGRTVAWHTAPVTIIGAPTMLRRLLLNLVDNALRHTPPHAAIRVQVGHDDGTPFLVVEDDGPGIPARDLPHVFDRFYRGAAQAEGHGLGLALCREIVERHRGRIAIAVRPTGGTSVTVTFRRPEAMA